jgi:uncharacterized protein YwgA
MSDPGPQDAAKIVSTAGGEIVGTTRLQKVGCLLELVGAGVGFRFAYHLFGPYSEDLSIAATDAHALGLIQVEEKTAAWGGRYSIYRASASRQPDVPLGVLSLAKAAVAADSVALELAVTAAFLAKNRSNQPWEEVASRKQGKATPDRLARAKHLYAKLEKFHLPQALPRI